MSLRPLEIRRPVPGCLLTVLLATVLAALSGCIEGPKPVPVYHKDLDQLRFTRVNLRADGAVLHASNYLAHPNVIHIGTPVRVLRYTREELTLEIEGREYSLLPVRSERFPTDPEGVKLVLDKLFVSRKDDIDLGELGPPELNDKVLAGLQMISMTKEQVYACLGPPLRIDAGVSTLPLSYEEILRSDTWTYPDKDLAGVIPRHAVFYFGNGLLQRQDP